MFCFVLYRDIGIFILKQINLTGIHLNFVLAEQNSTSAAQSRLCQILGAGHHEPSTWQ